MDRAARPPAGTRRNPGQDRRLRRLPHRPPRRGWRTAEPASAHHPGPRNRRQDRRPRRRRRRPANGRTRRPALARPHLRHLPLLPRRPRKPLRPPALHRLHTRRRLRDLGHRRRPLRFSAGRDRIRGLARPPALRRTHRLARPRHRRRRPQARALRLRRRRAHPRPGRHMAGPLHLRLHPPRRHGRQGFRPQPRRRLGRRLGRVPAGKARRRHHLRRRWRSRAPRPQGGAQRRPRRLRRYPHERHPELPYDLLWEERQLLSVANLTRQDGLDFLALAPNAGIVTSTTTYPLREANRALADLRAGRFEGAAVLVP